MTAEFESPFLHSSGRVVVCSNDVQIRRQTADLATRFGWEIRVAESSDSACDLLRETPFDACLVDVESAQRVAAEVSLLEEEYGRTTQMILPVSESRVGPATPNDPPRTEPWKLNCDILEKPYTKATLGSVLRSAIQRSRLLSENRRLTGQLGRRVLRAMLGHSTAMDKLRERIQQVAGSDSPVLVQGEPGTGTNLVAQAIHDGSRRAHRPFSKVACRIWSSAGLQRELFGLGKQPSGASLSMQPGRLELVSGGTLFLDDVNAVTLPVQRRLLQLLRRQACQVPPANQSHLLDVRVLVATHVDLKQHVQKGAFLAEFYDHLSKSSIQILPLRQRRVDIPLLTEHFLARIAEQEGRPIRRIAIAAQDLLNHHDWPGNVRELQNVIYRACALDRGHELTAEMIRPWLETSDCKDDIGVPGLTLKEMERKLIETTFARCGGNRERTARSLRIGLRTLSGKLREYGYPPRGGPGSNLKAA